MECGTFSSEPSAAGQASLRSLLEGVVQQKGTEEETPGARPGKKPLDKRFCPCRPRTPHQAEPIETLQLRPYTPESTGSRLISEVKLVMAQSVLWWGTTREYCVL